MWPHRQQPTRFPRPWDSPGKNTGVGCHFLLQCMKVKSESEVTQSCPTLSDPMDCILPGSSIHGIFQARVLEWGAIAFSKKNIYFCFVDYAKAFDCADHNKVWKILKEMGIPDHLTCLLMLKLKLQYFGHLMQKNWLIWKDPDAGERLKAGGEGDDRGWDGWMASPTQRTWVCINSRSWWWTGRPGVLQSMGSQSQTWLSIWTEPNDIGIRWLVFLFIRTFYWTLYFHWCKFHSWNSQYANYFPQLDVLCSSSFLPNSIRLDLQNTLPSLF